MNPTEPKRYATLMDRGWGRPSQMVEGTGPGGAIPFQVVLPVAISGDDDCRPRGKLRKDVIAARKAIRDHLREKNQETVEFKLQPRPMPTVRHR